VTKTDVALAEAQLASANSALAKAQGDYNVARETYNAKIGHYPGKLSPLPRVPATAKSVAAAKAIALRTNPQVLAAQHQAKAADLGVDGARADMMPSIDANAQLDQSFSGDAAGTGTRQERFFFGASTSPITESLGVTLRQTIYQGGQLSSALRRAIATQQRFKEILLQAGVDVSLQIGQAWSNILVSNASIKAGDEQIRAAQAAYDGVKQEADLGSRTTLDVLDAEQNLLSAKAARLQAGANLYISHYQLLQAMGLLTAEHLHLGIPTFDPSAYLNAVKHAPATTARGAKLDRILKTLGK
jgi:outer membrane protein